MSDDHVRSFPFSRSSPADTRPPLVPVLPPGGRVPDDIDARLAELARRAKSGDLAARNVLFLAFRPRLAPVLNGVRRNELWRTLEGRSWTFDDLEQEAFLIFCDLVQQWRGTEPRFAGFFFSRFRWRVFDTLRSWTVTPRREDSFDEAQSIAIDEQDAVELRVVADALFEALKVDDRQFIVWRAIDGWTDAEVAKMLGVSLKTVRRRRTAAFARARIALAELGDWRGDC